jgi:hypothetical protein
MDQPYYSHTVAVDTPMLREVMSYEVSYTTIVTDMAGYLAVAGSVMGDVSHTVVINEDEQLCVLFTK